MSLSNTAMTGASILVQVEPATPKPFDCSLEERNLLQRLRSAGNALVQIEVIAGKPQALVIITGSFKREILH